MPRSLLSLSLALTSLSGLGLLAGAGRPTAPVQQGRVTDVTGPIVGACVRFQGTALATRSGPDGSFRLPRRPGRITASHPGYFIAGADAAGEALALHLKPLPTEDNAAYRWVGPGPDPAQRQNCGHCHDTIFREWSASAHARSATGLHFLRTYAALLRDRPDGAGVCNACHVPTMPPDSENFLDARTARGVAAQGVHCDFCHKVQDIADGEFGVAHGRYNLRLLRPSEGQIFFGPLDDVDRGEDAFAPLYRESRYCASCHEGTLFGVPAYTTYSEWLQSPARRRGQQCQDCHMAPTGTMTNVAPGRGGLERDPRTLASHRFLAGSAEDMLRRAVSLDLRARRTTDGVRVAVDVRADGAGHRLPTGFVERHLVLVAEAANGAGRSVALHAGPRLPAAVGAPWAGRPGRLYAKLLRGLDGPGPAPFWNADPEPLDTRLTPGRPDHVEFVYPPEAASVRLRLYFRRFWPGGAAGHAGADEPVLVAEATATLSE